jgi:hypothetical protein
MRLRVAPVRLGCGSPGTVPGVRWPNLAAPIRLSCQRSRLGLQADLPLIATTLLSVSTLAQYAAQASISLRRFSNKSPRR